MQESLQNLLQQLFRADAADLDFGIYRIINYRRDQLQAFIKKHLRTYTRTNTADFFIHKDLNTFLIREHDTYLKSEVIPLSDLILTNVKNGGGENLTIS